jgi:hypothetical protein
VSAVQIIPIDANADFPYAAALLRLQKDADVIPKDFGPLIAAARKTGWPEDMIEANEELARRGRCYDFTLKSEPFLTGSLFEDGLEFRITGDKEAAMAYIKQLAVELGTLVFRL